LTPTARSVATSIDATHASTSPVALSMVTPPPPTQHADVRVCAAPHDLAHLTPHCGSVAPSVRCTRYSARPRLSRRLYLSPTQTRRCHSVRRYTSSSTLGSSLQINHSLHWCNHYSARPWLSLCLYLSTKTKPYPSADASTTALARGSLGAYTSTQDKWQMSERAPPYRPQLDSYCSSVAPSIGASTPSSANSGSPFGYTSAALICQHLHVVCGVSTLLRDFEARQNQDWLFNHDDHEDDDYDDQV